MYLSTWHKNHVNSICVKQDIQRILFLRREIRCPFPWFTHQKTRSRVSFHEEPANQINSPPSTETSYIAVWHQQCSKDVPRHGPVVGVRFRPWMEMGALCHHDPLIARYTSLEGRVTANVISPCKHEQKQPNFRPLKSQTKRTSCFFCQGFLWDSNPG